MVFQQPLLLYGLFLLTIPILIHFLNFRKSKTLYFSSLRFIEEVKSTYRKRNRLTDILLLLLRILALACLIIAFAQPVIPSKKADAGLSSSVVGLFIDNSRSMDLEEQGKSLLTNAKTKAREIIAGFPPDSRFRLLYNGSETGLTGITDKELTMKLIEGIQPAADELNMEEILRTFNPESNDQSAQPASVILISDFQQSLFEKPLTTTSSAIPVFLIPVRPASPANISIDTCWLDNPITLADQNNQVIARINNRSGEDYADFPVRLVINDTLRNETAINLPSGTVAEVALGFHPNTRGWQNGSVQISDFPVVFDNELLFSFRIESNIPVLMLFENTENQYFKKVYGDDPYFKFESFEKRGFPRSDFKDYNLLILSGIKSIDNRTSSKISDLLQSGGTVWFLPELNGDLANYNDFLKSVNIPQIQEILPYKVDSRIAADQTKWLQEVVVNVDKRLRLPYFNQSFRITPQSPDRIDLLNSVSGDLLLSQFRVGKGSFVLSGFPMDEKVTDLMFHPLFIPFCYRIAVTSMNNSALYRINGSDEPVIVPQAKKTGSSAIILKNSRTGFETIPAQRAGNGSETILFPSNLPEAGQYSAISGTDTLSWAAFNYSRKESDLSYLPDSMAGNRIRNAGWNISLNNNALIDEKLPNLASEISARKVWHYFLILALAALLAESFVMNKKK